MIDAYEAKAEMKMETKRLRELIVTKDQSMKELITENKQLKDKITQQKDDLQRSRDVFHEPVEWYEKGVAQLTQERDEEEQRLRAQVNSLQEESERLQGHFDCIQDESERLKERNKRLLTRMKTEKDSFEQNMITMTNQCDDLQRKVDELLIQRESTTTQHHSRSPLLTQEGSVTTANSRSTEPLTSTTSIHSSRVPTRASATRQVSTIAANPRLSETSTSSTITSTHSSGMATRASVAARRVKTFKSVCTKPRWV